MNKEDLFSYCLKIAKKENIEFYFKKNNLNKVSLEKFSIGKTNIKNSQSLLIKVIEKGSIGEYTIGIINKKNIQKGIKKAKEIAKIKPSIKLKDFASAKSKKVLKNSKNINKVNFEDLINQTKKEIKKEKYITGYEGSLSKIENYSFFINPYTSKEEIQNKIGFSVGINTKHKKASSAYYYDIFTKRKDVDIFKTIKQAKINAYRLLDPNQGEKGEYDLIFTPELTNTIIENLILSATIGENIYKKQSYLWNLKNKKVFSKKLNIYEDPHINYFTGSCNIDDEGNKTSKKQIIENGVFKKTIYDIYGSQLANKKATGNGFRSSTYSDISCAYSNVIQKQGSKKINNIIKNTKKGILVYGLMGFHTSNLTNGEFSLTISSGKEIENGEFKKTITNLNFSGNCKESFKDLYFSKEQKFFGDSLYSFSVLKNKKII